MNEEDIDFYVPIPPIRRTEYLMILPEEYNNMKKELEKKDQEIKKLRDDRKSYPFLAK